MWDYRLVNSINDDGVKVTGVHEVYYDKKHRPQTMTKNPVTLDIGTYEGQDTSEEMIKDLEMILRDLKSNKKILEYPEDFMDSYSISEEL